MVTPGNKAFHFAVAVYCGDRRNNLPGLAALTAVDSYVQRHLVGVALVKPDPGAI